MAFSVGFVRVVRSVIFFFFFLGGVVGFLF